jgi:hypothetical protein
MALRVEERIVSGGEDDDVVVHHLLLAGSNHAIGRHLGELARGRYRMAPAPAPEPLRVRAQREWLRRYAPVLLERMRGVADAFGVPVDDDTLDLSRLGASPPRASGSAVLVPGADAAGVHPRVARALDVPAPMARPRPGDPPPASRPYVIELHPDAGYPSLALAACDLLAALEGVNAVGLVVLAAFDGDGAESPSAGASGRPGLDAMQTVRHLLDCCATARDAREELLASDRHPIARARWLVADRSGDGFVFEAGGGIRGFAEEERASAPEETLAASGARSLWHGLYDARERTLDASFLVREAGAVRSANVSFQLAA